MARMDCKPNRPGPPGPSPRAETGRDHRNPGASLATPKTTDHRRYQNPPSGIGDVFSAPTIGTPSHPSTRRGEGVNVSSADAAHGCHDACTRTRVTTQDTSLVHHPRVESETPQGPTEAPLDGPPRQGRRCAHGRSFHRAAATACTVPGAGPRVLPARLTTPRASGQDVPCRSLRGPVTRPCTVPSPFLVPTPRPNSWRTRPITPAPVTTPCGDAHADAPRFALARALPLPARPCQRSLHRPLHRTASIPPAADPCAPRVSRIGPCTRQWNHSPAPRDRSATCTAPPQRGSVEISCPDPAGRSRAGRRPGTRLTPRVEREPDTAHREHQAGIARRQGATRTRQRSI